MSKSKILVLISGSIAAYKSCYLISKLVQNGFEVKVAASQSALKFIGRASLEGLCGNKVYCDTFEHGGAMDHINLVRWADLIIAAPASANFINKLAAGIGDDLLTTLTLAHDFKKPYLICPAMNTQMYLHPATQKAITNLREFGFEILETQSGVLACGEVGLGKLLDPELIFDAIVVALEKADHARPIAKAKSPKVLITSGGTIETIDNVRAITNRSSGKTGAALADIFVQMGHDVTFLTAQNGARPHNECQIFEFSDFKSIQKQLFELLDENQYDTIIHCAAISDFSVSKITANGIEVQANKISSDHTDLQIHLTKNPKLINSIKSKSSAKLFGFKLTSGLNDAQIREAVLKQIKYANCDYVVHNDLGETNSDKSLHHYNLFNKNGEKIAQFEGTFNLGLWLCEMV